jgi:hypothetical protein
MALYASTYIITCTWHYTPRHTLLHVHGIIRLDIHYYMYMALYALTYIITCTWHYTPRHTNSIRCGISEITKQLIQSNRS